MAQQRKPYSDSGRTPGATAPDWLARSGGVAAWGIGLGLVLAGLWLRQARPVPAETTAPFIDLATDHAWLLLLAGFTLWGQLLTEWWWGRRPGARRFLHGAWLALALLLTACLFINRVWATKTAVLADVGRVFWLDDDMMISLRYARHWAAGWGPVWNAGERVEGYTNFLWMLVMTVPHMLGLSPAKVPAFILALNGLGLLGVIGLTWRLGRRLGLPPAVRTLAALLVGANRWILYWAVAGSETVLLTLLILLLAERLLQARRWRPAGWGAGVLLGLLGLVRADALVLVAAFLPAWAVTCWDRRTRAWSWLPAVAIPAAHFLARRLYYGEWFPNTYYLKVWAVPTRAMWGSFYAADYLTLFGGVVALALLGLPALRRPAGRALGLVPLATLAYSAYIGGDELAEYRFYAPVLPLLIVLALGGAWRLLSQTAGRVRGRGRWVMPAGLRLAWLILVVLIVTPRSLVLPRMLNELGRDRGERERKNVQIGLMLRRHTRPQALIAHFWAGAAPYFSDRPALDLLGKADAWIAHRPAPVWDFQPGHNKYDAEYSFVRRRPDVVVAALPARLVLDPAAMRSEPARKNYPGLFLPLENSTFQRDYGSQYVSTPLSMDYHGLFVRAGSLLADPAPAWRE